MIALLVPLGLGDAVASEQEEASQASRSRLERDWALGDDGGGQSFLFKPYRTNYVLPVSYRSESGSGLDERADQTEVEFQLSLKARLSHDLLLEGGSLWFGYTQLSYWQAYKESAPFRETNFEPELRYVYELDGSLWGWRPRLLSIGLNHESNGRGNTASRSWNRLTLGLAAERDRFTLEARGWWRVFEPPEMNENPGITDKIGRGELRGHYDIQGHTVDLLLRSNLDVGDPRGAVRLGYAFPIHPVIRGYVRAFHGYGDSLIDYDEKTTRIGVGVEFARW
jgi:phospholipase A1